METKFETNFLVLPIHANDRSPLIFGGAFFSEMDLCAAQVANRALCSSEASYAVTHKAQVSWSKPSYVGDRIFLYGELVELGKKSMTINVKALREKPRSLDKDFIGEADFVFISVVDSDLSTKPEFLPYKNHNLSL